MNEDCVLYLEGSGKYFVNVAADGEVIKSDDITEAKTFLNSIEARNFVKQNLRQVFEAISIKPYIAAEE